MENNDIQTSIENISKSINDKFSALKNSINKYECEICYELVEIFSEGSVRHTGIQWCSVPADYSSTSTSTSDGDGGDGRTTSTTNTTSTLDDELRDWLEHIYDSKLENNECAKLVYDKLTTTGTMFNLMKDFMGNTPVAHLEWEIETLRSGLSGKTFASNSKELIHIQLDQDLSEKLPRFR